LFIHFILNFLQDAEYLYKTLLIEINKLKRELLSGGEGFPLLVQFKKENLRSYRTE